MHAALTAIALPLGAFIQDLPADRRVVVSINVIRGRVNNVTMMGHTTYTLNTNQTGTNRSPDADTNVHVVSPRTNQTTLNTNDVYQTKST